MSQANLTALIDAIARSSSAVVSLPSAGILRHIKSRFLMQVEGGFWVEATSAETLLIEELVRTQKQIAVSFKQGDKKVSFLVPVTKWQADFALNETTKISALLLPFPTEIKSTQRRNNYRVRVPSDSELRVRCWRIPEKAYLGDRPMAAQEITTAVRDVSMGGMGITFTGKDGQLPRVSPADRLRVQITYRDVVLLVEARMRHPGTPPRNDQIIAGLHFENLNAGLEGRRTQAELNKIVGDLQRDEVRRARLGLTA